MDETIAIPDATQRAIEKALVGGDLSDLSIDQRGALYQQVCASLGLNPLTQPFGYLTLNSKLRLYALKGCTDQLRALRRISIEILSMKVEQDLFIVHVRARDEAGRVDEDVGFAVITNKKGEDLGNAKLKAITKAKRRCTLSICGLGMLDESEVESIPTAKTYTADAVPETLALPPAPDPEPPQLTSEQVDGLFDLAEKGCHEPRDVLGRRLKDIMGLPREAKITKKLVKATMTTAQYTVAMRYYEQELKKRVEEDTPDFPPPPAGASSASASDEPLAPEPTPAQDPDAEAKDKLRAEVAGWALPVQPGEVEYILEHYAPEKARALLWGARRQKPEPTLIEAAAD
jgi:hypothetical protein